MRKIQRIALLVILASSRVASATDASKAKEELVEPHFTGWGGFIDQDVLWAGRNLDRNYTMGIGVFRSSGKWVEDSSFGTPLRFVDRVTQISDIHARRFGGGRRAQNSHSLMVSGAAFTPDELRDREPRWEDRPYASTLLLTVSRSTINPSDDRRDVFTSELTLGVLGHQIARVWQTEIHRALGGNVCSLDIPIEECPGSPFPVGWSNQISDGGEPTAMYRVSYLRAVEPSRYLDFAAQAEASVGYYTNAAMGGTVRMGWIRSDIWNVSVNPLSDTNQLLQTLGLDQPKQKSKSKWKTRDRRRDQLEFYGFASGRQRLVVYNALLQGQWGGAPHKLTPNEIERAVYEWQYGLGIGGCGVTLTIARSERGREHLLDERRSHAWAGAYLTYRARGLAPNGAKEPGCAETAKRYFERTFCATPTPGDSAIEPEE